MQSPFRSEARLLRRHLTSVGKLFLGLMFLFYIASVTSQSGLLLMLIGLMGGCFVVNWSFATRNTLNIRVTAPREVYLVEGGSATQPWKFENPSSKHAEVMEVVAGDKSLFRIPVVKAKDSVSVLPEIVYERRGVYPNALVTISNAAPYGVVRASRQLQLPGEVVVFPKIYDAEPPAAFGVDMISGGHSRGTRRVNHGSHFAGVRGWQEGDSLRQVHWKSTARRGEMMVKTFEEELGGRVSFLLDCVPGEIRVVDNAVRAGASLATSSLQHGHHVEFLDTSNKSGLRIAPFADEAELLERLARYEPASSAGIPVIDSFWKKSTLVLVGNMWRDEWRKLIDQAHAQRRSVQIYLPDSSTLPPNLDAELFYFSDREVWPRMEAAFTA